MLRSVRGTTTVRSGDVVAIPGDVLAGLDLRPASVVLRYAERG